MVTPGVSRTRRAACVGSRSAQALLWGAIGLGAFLLLAKSVQNSSEFGRWQPWILLVNIAGVIALSILLARKLWQPGARLPRARAGLAPARRARWRSSASLVIAPLLIVYLFSLEFLNRGIDSWFRVEVKQGLNDALALSRAALDLRMREYSTRTGSSPARWRASPPAELQRALDTERRASQALEIALFGARERILAVSLENPLREPAVAAAGGSAAPGASSAGRT